MSNETGTRANIPAGRRRPMLPRARASPWCRYLLDFLDFFELEEALAFFAGVSRFDSAARFPPRAGDLPASP